MFKRIATLVIAIALVITFVPNTQDAFAAKKPKKPLAILWVDLDDWYYNMKTTINWGNSKYAKKYEVKVKGPEKFWHKHKVVKKNKKNKKKYTVKGKYKVKKKGKKKYQVYKYGVAYKSYFTKKTWIDLPFKKGKKYYVKVRGVNGKLRGDYTKVKTITPEYDNPDDDDANAGFDGDYYIDEDY